MSEALQRLRKLVGLPEERQEHAPILEALNVAYNKGAESASQPAERDGQWVSLLKPDGTVAVDEGETYLFAIEVSTNGGKPHWEYFTDAIVWDTETDPDWSSGEHGWDINDELFFRALPAPPQPKERLQFP